MSRSSRVRTAAPGTPVAPARSKDRLPLFKYLRLTQENLIAMWPEKAFEQEFLAWGWPVRRVFLANSPAAARHVLLVNADNYVKSAIVQWMLGPALGQGLLTSEDDLWRAQRRIAAPRFHHKRILAFAEAMTFATGDMLARWDDLGAGPTVDVAQEMMRLTPEIISRTMFSNDFATEIQAVGDGVTRYQEAAARVGIADLLGLPPWVPRLGARKAKAAVAVLDDIILGIIADRRTHEGNRGDLLAMLSSERDPVTGEAMSERQLRDEVATIMLAGHETTVNALAWTWYLLSEHPWAEARLHDELDRVLQGRVAGADDLPKLAYTRRVIEESLRLYPPVHTIERDARGDDRISGHRVPAGSTVIVSPWLLHRHKKLWDDPDGFDPERFLPERAAARPKYAYIPIGGGPRSCIGANFAVTEAILVLATVAQRYRLRLDPTHAVEPVGLITLRPRHGLRVRLERRN